MENIINSIVLGIIEGLTEFLPISSTGHLIIATDILKLDPSKFSSFNIIIQLGAILAVLLLYHNRFIELLDLKNSLNYKNQNKLNAIHILLAILPVLTVGFFARKYIKAYLFGPKVVILSLISVGILMIIIEKIKPKSTIHSLDHITYQDSFIIGLAQCFALIPGVSRSGATMLMAMIRKVDVKISADFSFLISVPVIFIATVYELLKSYQLFNKEDLINLIVGFLVSFFVAYLAIKLFLSILKKLSLTPFAYYRIILGLWYYFYFIK